MALSVDYSVTPWLITVAKADLTLDSGTKYKLTVDTFWGLLRDYADSEEAVPFPVIYTRTAATASTPSITEVNASYYSLQFEDGLYSVNVIDGNTNIREVEVKNQVSVNTNNTTGFIDPTFLQTTTFIGKDGLGVAVEPINGIDSAQYPYGTRDNPCKTESNFRNIVSDRGFINIYALSNITLIEDYTGAPQIFYGDNPLTVNINCDAASDVASCEFRDVYITGKLSTNNVIRSCAVGSVTNANSFIYESAIIGPIVLSEDTSIEACWVAPAAVNREITIDFDGLAVQCIVSDWSAGIIRTKNMVTGSILGVSGAGGIIRIDPANTGGIVVWGGSTSAETANSELLDTFQDSSVSGQVWTDIRALTVAKYLGLK